MTHEKRIIFKLTREEEEAVRVFTDIVKDGIIIADEENDVDAYEKFKDFDDLLDWFYQVATL